MPSYTCTHTTVTIATHLYFRQLCLQLLHGDGRWGEGVDGRPHRLQPLTELVVVCLVAKHRLQQLSSLRERERRGGGVVSYTHNICTYVYFYYIHVYACIQCKHACTRLMCIHTYAHLCRYACIRNGEHTCIYMYSTSCTYMKKCRNIAMLQYTEMNLRNAIEKKQLCRSVSSFRLHVRTCMSLLLPSPSPHNSQLTLPALASTSLLGAPSPPPSLPHPHNSQPTLSALASTSLLSAPYRARMSAPTTTTSGAPGLSSQSGSIS